MNDLAYRWTMPWPWDPNVYHRCFESGVHLRADRCRCPCASCAEWAAENRHRAAAARIPMSMSRFLVVR